MGGVFINVLIQPTSYGVFINVLIQPTSYVAYKIKIYVTFFSPRLIHFNSILTQHRARELTHCQLLATQTYYIKVDVLKHVCYIRFRIFLILFLFFVVAALISSSSL